MKTKTFNKKLGLNKSTVANLSGKEMKQLLAAGTTTLYGKACSAPCETEYQVPRCGDTAMVNCYTMIPLC
jgi:hypothetical protein